MSKDFEIGDAVVVYRKGNVSYGTVANIRELESGTLVTVKYCSENDSFYRCYYLHETVIEKDHDVLV